jgi:hypothetical protein
MVPSKRRLKKDHLSPKLGHNESSATFLEEDKKTPYQILIISSSKNPAVVIFDQPNMDVLVHDLLQHTERVTETRITKLKKAIFVESGRSDLSLQDIRNTFYNISKDAEKGSLLLGSRMGVIEEPRSELSLKQLFESAKIKTVNRTTTRTKTIIVIVITEDVIIIIIYKKREVTSQKR